MLFWGSKLDNLSRVGYVTVALNMLLTQTGLGRCFLQVTSIRLDPLAPRRPPVCSPILPKYRSADGAAIAAFFTATCIQMTNATMHQLHGGSDCLCAPERIPLMDLRKITLNTHTVSGLFAWAMLSTAVVLCSFQRKTKRRGSFE